MGPVADPGGVWNRGQRFRMRVHDRDHILQFLAPRNANNSSNNELQFARPGRRHDLRRHLLPALGSTGVQGPNCGDCGG